MAVVVLQQWNPGLNKVALTKLLQNRANISLSVAKRHVDELLDGHEVSLAVPSLETAIEIARDAAALGVVLSVAGGTDGTILKSVGEGVKLLRENQ